MIFDRLSAKSRELLVSAANEAWLLHHPSLRREHFLIALTYTGMGEIAEFLKREGLQYQPLVSETLKLNPLRVPIEIEDIPLTPDCVALLTEAGPERDALNEYVTPEDILVALLAPDTGNIATIIEELGVDRTGLRQKVLERIG